MSIEAQLQERQEHLKFLQHISEAIAENKEDIKSMVISLYLGDRKQTMTRWCGGINACIGLTKRMEKEMLDSCCKGADN